MGIIKEHIETIDGKKYKCTTFPASEGLVILPKLMSLMGDDVANLLFGYGDDATERLMSDPAIAIKLLAAVAKNAEENDGLLVVRDLLKYTVFVHTHKEPTSKQPVELDRPILQIFDEHFAGEYKHLLDVALWVGRASFGNP